jgi:CRISPR associated protein Cas1
VLSCGAAAEGAAKGFVGFGVEMLRVGAEATIASAELIAEGAPTIAFFSAIEGWTAVAIGGGLFGLYAKVGKLSVSISIEKSPCAIVGKRKVLCSPGFIVTRGQIVKRAYSVITARPYSRHPRMAAGSSPNCNRFALLTSLERPPDRMPIKWRGTSRRPIPENWHFIGQRSSPYHLAGNRNAAHPVNAILNYAYAALESEIRIKAISDGCDPTVGIMHEGSDGSSKFIFDLMEPKRPKVDRAVLDFVKGHVFDPADFVIRSDGVCRLNPEMARMVVAKVCVENLRRRPAGLDMKRT